MGRHANAWAGMNLMIFGATPILPMKIEQSIATVSPDNELRIDSYENYQDALQFANTHGSVGFFIILEDCGSLQPSHVFHELSRAYKKRGWPSFGVLLYEKAPSIAGLQTLRKNPEIFDYISIESFTDPSKIALTLDKIWDDFVLSLESALLPIGLQKTLISLGTETLSLQEVRFFHRVKALLESNLNLTWLESFALKWSPVVDAVKLNHASALDPHARLQHVISTVQSQELGELRNVVDIAMAKTSLAKRVDRTLRLLIEAFREDRLNELLTFASTQNKPGAPALIRHLVVYKARILQFAQEERTANTSEREVG